MADTTIQDALVQMQKTQTAAEEALTKVNNHDADNSAHPYILAILRKLTQSDAVWTNEQIRDIIRDMLKEHTDTNFDIAHPGWEEYATKVEDRFEEMDTAYAELKDRVDQWYNQQGSSDLEQELQEVRDKYSAILESLNAAYQQAVESHQDELAAQYKETIAQTLQQQNAELLAVYEKWQQAQQPEVPVVQIYINFQSNGATGNMDSVYVNQGEPYILPECRFVAPDGYVFEKWSSNSTGEGATYGGAPGEEIDTSDIAASLTLYAIWKLVPVTEEALTKGITLMSNTDKAKATIKLVRTMRDN